MKKNIHPDYHQVVFRDSSTGDEFLTRSTASSSARVELADGSRYPLIVADVTSASHPFWTGNARIVDTQGQIQKFHQRFGQRVRQG
ncbi:type B 50S ribosomal protein L31 [Nakamurella sp. PAMC28650]|jgi:large subunit ribosomal protein L31|uniref:type B 50S ribosomal protein L31 n=1 Tax=Nakamurella sp. PAMC28650 TaxID=2762325 RepID=UPI00164D56A7|nr:type B 50S ribosomal protein L31 [Nakamurella sp. PAMC28650]QNK79226.1 type B 50S ribosomal protein L31 [Nakamurella sp. PAMC28650]